MQKPINQGLIVFYTRYALHYDNNRRGLNIKSVLLGTLVIALIAFGGWCLWLSIIPEDIKNKVGTQSDIKKDENKIETDIQDASEVDEKKETQKQEDADCIMPDFSGLQLYSEEYEKYKQELKNHNISVRAIIGKHGSLKTCSNIIRQDPGAGRELSEGAVVKVYYDNGPPHDYFNSYEVDEAEKFITDNGWGVKKDYIKTLLSKEGTIIDSTNNLRDHKIILNIYKRPKLDKGLKDNTKDSGCTISTEKTEYELKKDEHISIKISFGGNLPENYTCWYENSINNIEIDWGEWGTDDSCPLEITAKDVGEGYIRIYLTESSDKEDAEMTDCAVLAYCDIYVNISK